MDETLEQQTTDVQETTPESVNVQPQGQELNTQEDIFDWTKDKRYSDMWKSDPNNLYRSYKQIEKYDMNEAKQILGKYGLKEFSELDSVFEKYKEYENPENPKNLLFNKLNDLASHEKYGGMLSKAFEDIRQQQLRDKWGEQAPPELIQKLEELDSYKAMFEKQEQEKEFNKNVETLQSSLTSAFENVFKLAEEHKIDVNIQEFINHCQEKKINPEYIEAEFLKQALPNILKAKEIKSAESIQNNIQANAKAGLANSSKVQPQQQTNKTQDKLEGFFKKYGIE